MATTTTEFLQRRYNQHMYYPLLIFERHTGCLLAARLRRGTAASHARIVPLLLRLVLRLQQEFPGVRIQLRADAGFFLPLLYEFCEFFGLQYAIGIPANGVFQRRAARLQRRLARRYRRTQQPQRSFSSFPHQARSWFRQRRICYKAEHTATGTNLRFLVTNRKGRSRSIFDFYNDRGECENRIASSTSSACTCPRPSARPRSKLCVLSCSRSVPAFARQPAACASTWPAVGPFNISSKP